MKVAASMARPVSWLIWAMGSMSLTSVRAAQLGLDRQPAVGDLPGQGAHLVHHARPGPGQPNVGRGDAEVGHQVEQAELVRQRGILTPTATAARPAGSRR